MIHVMMEDGKNKGTVGFQCFHNWKQKATSQPQLVQNGSVLIYGRGVGQIMCNFDLAQVFHLVRDDSQYYDVLNYCERFPLVLVAKTTKGSTGHVPLVSAFAIFPPFCFEGFGG